MAKIPSPSVRRIAGIVQRRRLRPLPLAVGLRRLHPSRRRSSAVVPRRRLPPFLLHHFTRSPGLTPPHRTRAAARPSLVRRLGPRAGLLCHRTSPSFEQPVLPSSTRRAQPPSFAPLAAVRQPPKDKFFKLKFCSFPCVRFTNFDSSIWCLLSL